MIHHDDRDHGSCPVFVDCIAERMRNDDELALKAALAQWDKYRWPITVMAVLGRFLIKYRKKKNG